jgi:L-seryl-tRNA(Ser) seleniumtransferase
MGPQNTGLILARPEIVEACAANASPNHSLGRSMKVGKEGIVGALAALQAWKSRDHEGIRARERRALDAWVDVLDGRPGIAATIVPDPTNNPLDRLKVAVDPEAANITAWDLADRLAAGDPPVIVRDHEVEHGYFFLDPCNLHGEEEFTVAKRLAEELESARQSNTIIATPFEERLLAREAAILGWPD